MEKLWYVVNTYSGHEAKVKEKLEMRAETMGFTDYIFRVIIPEEKVKGALQYFNTDGDGKLSKEEFLNQNRFKLYLL